MSMCKVICVTNRKLAGESFVSRIEKAVKAGVGAVILREKDLSEEKYEELAGKIKPICDSGRVPLVLHTYPSAARRLGVMRLHLSFNAYMELSGEEKKDFEKIGVSVHSLQEAKAAEEKGAAYVIAGHIFATDCKKGVPPRGLDYLKEICQGVKIPVYAIGGITSENAKQCIDAGAAGVCMMSSLMRADDK